MRGLALGGEVAETWVPGMNTNTSGRVRACRDRCEVCNAVIEHRQVANRRRCADHLDQLVLVPAALVRKTTKNTTVRQVDQASKGASQ